VAEEELSAEGASGNWSVADAVFRGEAAICWAASVHGRQRLPESERTARRERDRVCTYLSLPVWVFLAIDAFGAPELQKDAYLRGCALC
jgi:hypothetical protein